VCPRLARLLYHEDTGERRERRPFRILFRLLIYLHRDPSGRMAQQLLDDLYIFTVLSEQTRERMTERMPPEVSSISPTPLTWRSSTSSAPWYDFFALVGGVFFEGIRP
jgi:hypothetical protein